MLVAIVICIHDTHSTEQLVTFVIYPGQYLTLSGFVLHSSPQPQAIVASTKIPVLSDMVLFGFKIRSFSAVPLRATTMVGKNAGCIPLFYFDLTRVSVVLTILGCIVPVILYILA